MKQILIFLLFLGITSTNDCVSQNVELNAVSVSNLDTTFLAIIFDHIEEMKVAGNYNPLDSIMIIFIDPIIAHSSGVPEKIIDSLYSINDFPLTPESRSYSIVVMSLSANCEILNSIKIYKSRFYTKLNDLDILIVSMLNIRLGNRKEIVSFPICSGDPCDKRCDDSLEKITAYIYHPNEIIQTKYTDIWLQNNTLINHPRK